MVLNHKQAIEFLIEAAEEIGVNRFTVLNLHALLADNLLPNPDACGRTRNMNVGIQGSVFHPLGVPQLIDEFFSSVDTLVKLRSRPMRARGVSPGIVFDRNRTVFRVRRKRRPAGFQRQPNRTGVVPTDVTQALPRTGTPSRGGCCSSRSRASTAAIRLRARSRPTSRPSLLKCQLTRRVP